MLRFLGICLPQVTTSILNYGYAYADEIANAVEYALQCNAHIGVIDSVSV